MPADRLTHPRIGRSRKVTALNDLEFRVWDTYRWVADDFGVAPKNAEFLRGMNDALRIQHTEAEVAAALQRLVELEVIIEFDHQGAPYVCSLEWNKHQKIDYPRQTFYPAPSPEIIQRMDVTTRNLFRMFHEFFVRISGSRARARAKRLKAKANGKGLGEGQQQALFEQFWAAYPRKTAKAIAFKEWLRITPPADDAITTAMIAKIQEQRVSTQWLKDGGQFIPHARTWLHQQRWKDEPDDVPPPLTGRTIDVLRGLS